MADPRRGGAPRGRCTRDALEAELADVRAALDDARALVQTLEGQEADLVDRLEHWESDDEEGEEGEEGDLGDGANTPEPLSSQNWDDYNAQIELPPRLEDDEDGGGELRDVTEEDVAAQHALQTELRAAGLDVDVDALCAWILEQLAPQEIARGICFDGVKYSRELLGAMLRSRVRNTGTPFITPDQQEHFVCGGATQAGKTMFVVVGVVVAFAARMPSVVITTTVSGTKSLFAKVRATLQKMPAGALLAACVSDLSGSSTEARNAQRAALGASDDAQLGGRGTLFVADTARQIARATELLKELRHDASDDPELPCTGQFLLFLDEADALQRTDGEENEMIQLERRLATLCGGVQNSAGQWCRVEDDRKDKKKKVLGKPAGVFKGPQAVVAISATLLPVFMRTASRSLKGAAAAAAVHPFYIERSNENMKQYRGVLWDKWRPLTDPDTKAPVYLERGALTFKNNSINDDVEALYRDAAGRKFSLLLDITVSRVFTDEGTIFDKARAMQRKFPDLAVLTTYGGGIEIFLPKTCGGGVRKVPRRSELTVFDLLTLMEEGVQCRPAYGDAEQTPEWHARQQAGRRELGTLPRMCDKPFAVIGYTMMIRGESFRSDRRVPTHMVNHMSGAMSIDRIVQSAGRATFQDFGGFLEKHGFDGVSVLMLKYDYETVRAYMRLMDEIKRRIVIGKQTVAQCFSADAEPYPDDLWVLLDPGQKRRVGNLREGHKLEIPVAGAAERAAAAAAETERVAREKREKIEAAAAEKAAAKAERERLREAKKAAAAAAKYAKSAEKEAAKQKKAAENAQKAAEKAEKKAEKAAQRAAAPSSIKRPHDAEGYPIDDGGGAAGAAAADTGAAERNRKRCKTNTLADVLAWALKMHAALQLPDAAPAPVPFSRLYIQVLRCGTLRSEPAFRSLAATGRVKTVSVLLPVGYRAMRTAKGQAGAFDVYEVLLGQDASGAPAPKFVVWRAASAAEAAGPTPADARAADDPIAACEDAAERAAAQAASDPAAAGPAAARTPRTATNMQTFIAYFGLDSQFVRALLELLPGLDACCASPDPYVKLQDAADAAARADAAAAAAGGAAGGADTPSIGGLFMTPAASGGAAGASGSLPPARLFGTPTEGHAGDAAQADDASGPGSCVLL